MTDGDALYAAILAAPDDDTPRLVYADWLEENDQPERAEFIRVQIELARMPPGERVPWNRRVIELRAREKAILVTRGDEWLAPLREKGEPLQSGDTSGEFRRGFVEIVWMPATWFCLRAEALFARVPVRELRVTRTTDAEFGQLMMYPLLGRLGGLDLSDRRLGDAAARLVSWCPFTSGLRVLRLRGCGITDEGAYLLADEFGRPLHELDVSHNPISPVGVAILREQFGDAVRADAMEPTA
jgi:uncharacterized protein (TIGR02996 family)